MKLEDIARRLPATVVGDGGIEIAGLAHPDDATPGHLAVALASDVALAGTKARAAAVRKVPDENPDGMAFVVCEGDPRVTLAGLTAMFDAGPAVTPGVHASAVVADDAALGADVSIGAGAVVGAGARIGARTRIMANATIGAGVEIGDDGLVFPGVVVCDRVRIGDRVILHPNAVIGSDGFSFASPTPGTARAEDRFPRIHSLGTVVIGDDVEIGAGTTIDRATLRATSIGSGTKIDNQVQVAHNGTVGRAVIICGQAGLAGSVVVGDGVVMAASTGVGDHVRVGERAVLTALAGVMSNVPDGEAVMGAPAVPRALWLSRYANLNRIERLLRQVADLTKRIVALEGAADRKEKDSKVGETDV